MSMDERDRLWMAYLDGEMSSTEAAAFDQSLTPEERARLSAEVRFESGLAEALQQGGACPESVWRRTEMLVRNQSELPRRRAQRGWRIAFGAVAALLLVGISYWGSLPFSSDPVFGIASPDLGSFARLSETITDASAIEAFLNAHGIDLTLSSGKLMFRKPGHGIRVLGVREMEGHDVIELLVNCCGFPAKIVLAGAGSDGAELIQGGATRGEVQLMSPIGSFVAGVVSKHHTPGLLDLLRSADSVAV
jgi:hypothetical protein